MQAEELTAQTPTLGAVPVARQIVVWPPSAGGRGAKRPSGADRIHLPSRQLPQKGQNGRRGGVLKPSFKEDLVSAIPRLRAFAISLVRQPDRADDLVQETLVRAWQNRRHFTEGTNMVAWLITLLRNQFYSEQRRRCRELEDPDGMYAQTLVVPAEQLSRPDCRALHDALLKLPSEMRESILLVTVSGLSYAEAAKVCGCELGTIKSRLNRARSRLAALLVIETPADFVADPLSWCVVARLEQGRLCHAG